MPHQCIKYQLNPDGTPPSFLCMHAGNMRGLFPVMDPTIALANNTTYVGLSEGDDVGNAEVFSTQAELQTYLATVGAQWTQPDPAQPDNPNAAIPFDSAAAAQRLWALKNTLDAGV